MAETRQVVVSGAEAPESAAPVVEGERTTEGAEVAAMPKKRKMPAGRVPEGGVPDEREKRKKKRDQVPDLVGGGEEEPITKALTAAVARADKDKAVAEGSMALLKSRSGGRAETALTSSRKKKHVVNFHYAQDHMLCDDIYSSMGFLLQLTWSDMALPKMLEFTESDWYRMMASTITRVSTLFLIVDMYTCHKF